MSIEFHCSGCGKLLRVPDEVAGKEAQCPSCGKVLTAPMTSTVSQENPYQSPMLNGLEGMAQHPMEHSSFLPPRITMGDVFGRTWEIFKVCWGACLLGSACYALLYWIPVELFSGIGKAVPALQIALPLVVQIVNAWAGAGAMQYFLKIARGEPVSLDILLSGGPYMIRVLVVNLIVFMMTFVGSMLFIIPGIILALMFWPAVWLVVDRDVGIGNALGMSQDISAGNKWAMFKIFFVLGIVYVALTVVILSPLSSLGLLQIPQVATPTEMVLGLMQNPLLVVVSSLLNALVIVPFSFLLMAVAYLMMTGQLPPESEIETQ